MKADQFILTRQLPKTGQEILYHTGDDGEYEAGWWRGLLNANNRVRFIPKTIDGDDVVIDRATGLMWAADGNAAGCNNHNRDIWEDCIDYANALDFAGFTDWRVPNIVELSSIVDYIQNNPSIDETFFPNTAPADYWASTTYIDNTNQAWLLQFDEGWDYYGNKSLKKYLRCVRGGL